jgi:putative membrane protein
MIKRRIAILASVLLLVIVLAPTPSLAQVQTPTNYQQLGEQWMDRQMGTLLGRSPFPLPRGEGWGEGSLAAVMGEASVRQMQETMGRVIAEGQDTAGLWMPMFGRKGVTPMMGYGWHWGMGWGFMMICGVVVLGLLVWLIFLLVRRRYHEAMGPMAMYMGMGGMRHTHGDSGDSALQILKERYAKGEINKEQFDQMKRDLLT